MLFRPLGFALVAALAVGCGAKTGLDVPDISFDAGVDAGTDASVMYPCVEVPPDGGVILLPLDLEAELARADVFFLVDNTLSMEAEIGRIRERLRDTIAPGIARAIPDSQLGAGTFADFPEATCGQPGDEPFALVLPITDDLNRAQAAIDAFGMGGGSDRPEAQVEALYHTATGEGHGSYVPPSFGCPTGGVGYPCFRPDALSVIVMFTDAPFHNGPGGSEPYSRACSVSPTPHTYEQALEALDRLDARVIGIYSGGPDGREDLVSIARDTGAVSDDGPLVFDIGERGERLSEAVVSAIETLANVIRFDVDTVLVDPDRTDGVDPTLFVDSVVPLSASPMSNVESIDREAGVFRGVLAGTRVTFELRIVAGAVVPGPTAQRFLLEVIFRGDGRARLGSRIIEIVIPGADGSGCEDGPTP
ncbi:MAG: VWA domain-containing protein [Sandaracinaceae bacterium]|nr:VWA domain-containing protein [Sandaracinaceae bacterium]